MLPGSADIEASLYYIFVRLQIVISIPASWSPGSQQADVRGLCAVRQFMVLVGCHVLIPNLLQAHFLIACLHE